MWELMPVLRLLHIVFGVFWVGSVLYQTLILEPRLKTLGPQVQQSVMGALAPLIAPAMIVSSTTVFATGSLMTLTLRAGRLDSLLTSGWGMAIFTGFVATVASLVIGLGGLTPTGIRISRLGAQLAGQQPSLEQIATLARLGHRMEILGRADLVLVVIALVSMPLARFV